MNGRPRAPQRQRQIHSQVPQASAPLSVPPPASRPPDCGHGHRRCPEAQGGRPRKFALPRLSLRPFSVLSLPSSGACFCLPFSSRLHFSLVSLPLFLLVPPCVWHTFSDSVALCSALRSGASRTGTSSPFSPSLLRLQKFSGSWVPGRGNGGLSVLWRPWR